MITPISEQTFCYGDIMNIDRKYLPLPVLGFSPRSIFTLGVATRTSGDWSHFMWMIEPGVFASQGWFYRRKTLEDYREYTLKFVYNPAWSEAQKKVLMDSILRELSKSHWETRYDILAIFGQLVGLKWIQHGRLEICSDDANRIGLIDFRYNLKYPSPADVNAWMKLYKWSPDNPNGYLVLGRFFGRD